MSATAQTKLFGMRIPVDPKIFFGALAFLIGVLFWYNLRSDDEPGATGSSSARTEGVPAPAIPLRTRTPVSRRSAISNDRGVLRLRPIDATKGDIDPTLRLDLLARLQGLQPVSSGRSLFEADGQQGTGVTVVPVHAPILQPKPRPILPGMPGSPGYVPANPVVSIPLKYYGYVRPSQMAGNLKPGNNQANNPANNRGFFLDGDNVLVASEGELLKQRYLVVELTPNSAKMEDTQLRQPATLPVVAAAQP